MAGEAVSSIRMIKALNAEGRFAKRYMQAINEAAKWSTRQKIQVGASLGKFFFHVLVLEEIEMSLRLSVLGTSRDDKSPAMIISRSGYLHTFC